MQKLRLRRFAGVAFAAAFIAGALVYGSGAGKTDSEITAYYADSSNRARQLAGFAIVLAAALAYLLFAATFRSRTALLSGGISAALLIGANALWAASAFAVEVESGYAIDPRTHLIVEDAGFALFVSAAAAAIPLVCAVSLGPARPTWVRPAGLVTVAALATSFAYFPFFVFLAWVLAIAVLPRLEA